MDDLDFQLNGQQIAKLCKRILPSTDDELLLAKLQELIPNHKLWLARIGNEWYRLGGIVNMQGNRIAQDLVEWTERTFIVAFETTSEVKHTDWIDLITCLAYLLPSFVFLQ
jgi:hypothetical protein